MSAPAAFAVGSLIAIGFCALANLLGTFRSTSTSEERTGLLATTRKSTPRPKPPLEDELLSTIAEGSEYERASSRMHSEHAEDHNSQLGRATPHSQQLDASDLEDHARLSPRPLMSRETSPMPQAVTAKISPATSGLQVGRPRVSKSQKPGATAETSAAEDDDMATALFSPASEAPYLEADTATTKYYEAEQPDSLPPSASASSLSLYETSKSQAKEQVSPDSLQLFIDSTPPVPKRSAIHESLKFGFVVKNVLTPLECDHFIRQTEAINYTKWTKDEARLAFRDCDTIEIERDDLAELLWSRIQPAMEAWEKDTFIDRESDPERWQRDLEGQWIADGTVRGLLFSRYTEGGHFAAHTDGFNIETFDRRSLYSIVLYLNDVPDGDGGETIFYSNDAKDKMKKDEMGRIIGDPAYIVAKVRPVAGTATVFFHNILHQSEPIRIGSASRKYIIRSDVMFSRTPPLVSNEKDAEAFAMYQKAEQLSDSNPEESAKLFRTAFKRSTLLQRIYGM